MNRRLISTHLLRVKGNSMEPAIKQDDLVLVETDFDDIDIGDVVLFSNGNGASRTLHRVIEVVDERIFILKGDNAELADRPVRREKIDGKLLCRLLKRRSK